AWPAGGGPARPVRGSRSWGSSTPRHPCSGLLRCVASVRPGRSGAYREARRRRHPPRLAYPALTAWLVPCRGRRRGEARGEPLLQVLTRAVRCGGVFLVGMTLLVAGAAMLVLPGPGIAVILLRLVVLCAHSK